MSANIEKYTGIDFPKSMSFFDMPKRTAVMGKRKRFNINPTSNLPHWKYNSNNKIRLYLPSTGFLDTRHSALTFYADNENSGAVFGNFIETLFNSFKLVLSNSEEIENIKQYNFLAAASQKYEMSRDYAETIGRNLMGIEKSYENRANQSADGARYAVNFAGSGLWKSARYIPLGVMSKLLKNTTTMYIEIELENPTNCMSWLDGDIPDYKLQEIVMAVEVIEDPELEQQIYNKIQNGEEVVIPYESHQHYSNILQNNRSGEIVFPIFDYKSSMTGVKTIFYKRPGNEEDKINTFTRPSYDALAGGLMNYNYNVGNEDYPTNRVLLEGKYNTANSYLQLINYLGHDKLSGYCCGVNNGKTTSPAYVQGYRLQAINLLANADFGLGYVDLPVLNVQVVEDDFILVDVDGNKVNNDGFLKVPYTGTYAVTYSFDLDMYTTDGQAGTSDYVFQFNIAGDKGYEIEELETRITRAPVETFPADAKRERVTVSANVSLDPPAGPLDLTKFGYCVTVKLGDTVSQFSAISIQNMTVSMQYLDEPENTYYNKDFMIAQSFKNWYEEPKDLYNKDYLLSGVNTRNQNPVNFRFYLDQVESSGQDLTVLHYTDYNAMLIMKKDSVKVWN